MSKPLFVGNVERINLALVTQITHHGNVMHFVFGGSQSSGEEGITPDWMELPEVTSSVAAAGKKKEPDRRSRVFSRLVLDQAAVAAPARVRVSVLLAATTNTLATHAISAGHPRA